MEFTKENYAAFAATKIHCGGKQFLKADQQFVCYILKGNIKYSTLHTNHTLYQGHSTFFVNNRCQQQEMKSQEALKIWKKIYLMNSIRIMY